MFVLAALPIPRSLQSNIASIQASPAYGQWLRPSRMELHITLKSPQEIMDAQRIAWTSVVGDVCSNHASISLAASGLVFLTTSVLALNVSTGPLLPLHNDLVTALQPYGEPSDALHERDRFHAHITIGRGLHGPLDALQRRQMLQELAAFQIRYDFTATFVRLYGRDEAVYRPLMDVSLSGSL